MTGSLFAPLPLASPSPVRSIAPNFSVDSFSEFSTRTVNRSSYSPTSAASGSRSARAKEEDEELFRDLFAGENDAEAAPTFIPQKPVTRRAPLSTGNLNPRHHLAPMKPVVLPQSVVSTPFIPRLKLEELVNVRPDDDDDDNNNSLRTSRRGSELEQVTEEDASYFDDGQNEDIDRKATPTKAQVLTCDRGFNSSLGFASNHKRSNNNSIHDILEQETLRFLEKLDLKAVLQTPRPDVLSFHPGMAVTPTSASQASPHSEGPNIPATLIDGYLLEKPAKDRIGVAEEQSKLILKKFLKVSRVNSIASRLAHMESTYGTAPIVRKTRRETIDRLANPFSGYSATLQALSPKQREKRESALTTRVPLSPISAAIAVSGRRGITAKKVKTPATLLGGVSKRVGDYEIPVPKLANFKRKAAKQQDPLVHKRRPNSSTNSHVGDQGPSISKRKSKTTLGSCSLVVRKEALKQKLQNRSGPTKRGEDRKIGGSTFLTQHDDEVGVELIKDFTVRHRGAAQASLTFRSGTKAPQRRAISALPTRKSTTARSRPRPPQTRVGVSSARVSCVSEYISKERNSQEIESLGNTTACKTKRPRAPINSTRSGSDHQPVKLFQQPRRPQPWQATSIGQSATSARSLTGRPTTPGGITNPLRRLKVHPAMPTLLPRAPKPPPSAATTLLMGSTPHFSLSGATVDDVKNTRRSTKKVSVRKSKRSFSKGTGTSFEAPTKASEQRKRPTTTLLVQTAEKRSQFLERCSQYDTRARNWRSSGYPARP